MNLTELWSGNDYAYYEYKGRGETFRSNALRVKIIRTFKQATSEAGERLSGFAEVLICDVETGEPKTRTDGEHVTREVRARDIAMRWDEYEQEKAYRQAEQERLARERQERRERLQREQEEAEAAERAKINKLKELLLLKHNIPENLIYNITGTGITLSRSRLEEELGI